MSLYQQGAKLGWNGPEMVISIQYHSTGIHVVGKKTIPPNTTHCYMSVYRYPCSSSLREGGLKLRNFI